MSQTSTSAATERVTLRNSDDDSPNLIAQKDVGLTMTDAAYRQLRADIISGERAPEERLRLEKLKTIYSIGPTPLREALQKLSAEQLVVSQGNRGFTVAPLLFSEFEDLNIARTSIEKEAIRLSIEKGDNNWEASVVAAHYLLKKEDKRLLTHAGRVTDSWDNANTAFHSAIVEACGSKWLLRCRASLGDLCTRYRRNSIYQQKVERDLASEHEEIAQAVLDRDATAVCTLTENHFALTARSLSIDESDSANSDCARS